MIANVPGIAVNLNVMQANEQIVNVPVDAENPNLMQANEQGEIANQIAQEQPRTPIPVIDFAQIGRGLAAAGRAFKTTFYDQSFRLAFNGERIASLKEKYKDYTQIQKFALGVLQGAINSAVMTFIMVSPKGWTNESPAPITQIISTLAYPVIGAVAEELVFRGGIQNMIGHAQTAAMKYAPECLRNNRAFQWLTSPGAKILAVNAAFAYAHYAVKDRFGRVRTLQSARIFLFPLMSNLHETTGGLAAPLGAHLTNNILTSLAKALDPDAKMIL